MKIAPEYFNSIPLWVDPCGNVEEHIPEVEMGVFWKAHLHVAEELAPVALMLNDVHATEACVERTFSSQKNPNSEANTT